MFYSLPSIIHGSEPARRVYAVLNSQKVGDLEKFMTPASQPRRLCSSVNKETRQRRVRFTTRGATPAGKDGLSSAWNGRGTQRRAAAGHRLLSPEPVGCSADTLPWEH